VFWNLIQCTQLVLLMLTYGTIHSDYDISNCPIPWPFLSRLQENKSKRTRQSVNVNHKYISSYLTTSTSKVSKRRKNWLMIRNSSMMKLYHATVAQIQSRTKFTKRHAWKYDIIPWKLIVNRYFNSIN